MVILHINKITFEKSENLEKKLCKSEPGQNFNRILLLFLKKFFFMVFLILPWRK